MRDTVVSNGKGREIIVHAPHALPFGPYRGRNLVDVPRNYLEQIRDDLVLHDMPGLRRAVVDRLRDSSSASARRG